MIPPSDEIEEKYDEKTGTIERIIHQRDPEKEILFKVDVSFSSLPFEKILEEANGIPEVDFSTAVDVRTFTNTLVR